MTRPRKHFFTCTCGGTGKPSTVKMMKDGTKKRYVRCRSCKKVWHEPVKEETVIEHWGLWLGVNGVWYSPRDQERIREICENIL